MIKKFIASLLLVTTSGGILHAQDYNLDRDTIKVSSSGGAYITFPGMVQDVPQICSDYNIQWDENHLSMRAAVKKPAPFCTLVVAEGTGSDRRSHALIIAFVKEVEPSEQMHNYSTKERLAAQVAYLAAARKAAVTGASGTAITNPMQTDGRHDGISSRHVPTPAEANVSNSTSVNGIPVELINERVRLTIRSFYQICERLGYKQDVLGSITGGMRLFNNNDSAIVETTSPKSGKKQKKIRQYFKHLSQLPYQRIRMTKSDVQYVSNFFLGDDGKWHGTCKVIQNFEGLIDGNIVVYLDKTEKTVDLIMYVYQIEVGDKIMNMFNIFLGNITVDNIN